MKAIRIHEFGPTEEVLRYEDVTTPDPAADEILIKVEAAALIRADLGWRKGTYRVSPDQLPIIPGREFAGPIAKIGATVKDLKVGDHGQRRKGAQTAQIGRGRDHRRFVNRFRSGSHARHREPRP